mmetsp:Transcript_14894/g.37314  ORF Transcript_14894/g.37314 Transcript_14894/m.37314 type:complete len:218 (-) Transcript_14894:311-964(-)
MGVKDGLLDDTETTAPQMVNSATQNDAPRQGCCNLPGGRDQGYAHDICECCCGEFNMSTYCMSAFCPCVVFYKTAQEFNRRSGQLSGEANICTKNPLLAGILGAVAPVLEAISPGVQTAPGAASAVGVSAATMSNAAAASQCMSTVGTCVQVGLTCAMTEELKQMQGHHIREDACMTFCCALCCTPCRMTQVYHTLTDDDVGCGCCCHPRKTHEQMQ